MCKMLARSICWIVCAMLSIAFVQISLAQEDGILAPNLVKHLEEMDPGELVPVLITMQQQVTNLEMGAAQSLPTKAERRAAVISALKNVADRTQQDLLTYLNGKENAKQASLIRPFWLHNFVAVEVDRETALELALRTDISRISLESFVGEEIFPVLPDRKIIQPQSPLITAGGSTECGVDLMEAPRVWNELGFTGDGVVVAVIDTGICFEHPDLSGREWINLDEIPNNGQDDDNNGQVDDINGWNFRDNTPDIADDNSHGTHVTGTVAGTGTNGIQTGIAPGAAIMGLKFWNNLSGESVALACVQYAVDNDADVVSSSWGWPHAANPDRAVWRASMENSIATGIVLVFAAGNERGFYIPPDAVRTPGDVPDIITVGATDCIDRLASFSSPGPVTWQDISPWNDWPMPTGKIKPSIAAPGVETTSTYYDCQSYVQYSGTSMATPHVAGAVALMLEKNPELDHFDVKQILMDSSLDLGPAGMDNDYGMGRVNAFDAVQFTPETTVSVAPENLAVNIGTANSGGVPELMDSDDQYVVLDPTFIAFRYQLEFTVDAISPSSSPGVLEFSYESSAFNFLGTVDQQIELFNYDSGQFETLDTRLTSPADTVVSVVPGGDPAQFIQVGTNAMQARISYENSLPFWVFSFQNLYLPYRVRADQIVWTITP